MSLASRGLRDFGHGTETIDDDAEVAAVRAQAAAVRKKALLATAVLTLLALLV